jgi:prephenate dehydrogenase
MEGTQLDFNAIVQAARQVERDKAELLEVLSAFDTLIRELVNGQYQTRRGSQALNQIASEFSSNKRQMLEPMTTLAQELDQAKEKAEQGDTADAQRIINDLRSDR